MSLFPFLGLEMEEGPKPENIELGIRMKDLENSPRVRLMQTFHRLEKKRFFRYLGR